MEAINIKTHIALLGLRVRDRVTGFEGVVTSVCFDLYGCIQAIVQPEAKDGKHGDSGWFDVNRLLKIGREPYKPVMPTPDFDFGPVAEGRKGPANKPLWKS